MPVFVRLEKSMLEPPEVYVHETVVNGVGSKVVGARVVGVVVDGATVVAGPGGPVRRQQVSAQNLRKRSQASAGV